MDILNFKDGEPHRRSRCELRPRRWLFVTENNQMSPDPRLGEFEGAWTLKCYRIVLAWDHNASIPLFALWRSNMICAEAQKMAFNPSLVLKKGNLALKMEPNREKNLNFTVK